MLDQRRRRWSNIIQMLYTCFVLTGNLIASSISLSFLKLEFLMQFIPASNTEKCWMLNVLLV